MLVKFLQPYFTLVILETMKPWEKINLFTPSKKRRTKNPKKKIPPPSPLTKCRTKRRTSTKIIQGTFVATANIEDAFDETSTMEDGNTWMTTSEAGETMETIDDVFDDNTKKTPENRESAYEDTTLIIPEREEGLSSPETLRRSERQYDDWSVSHLREDSIESPRKGTVNDIIPSPERGKASGSDQSQEGTYISDRAFVPEIHPTTPYFEKVFDFSSLIFGPSNKIYEAEFQSDRVLEKKSKIPKKGSKGHRKEFLHSTKIDCPERASVQRPISSSHVEEFGSVSPISLNRGSEDKCQHEDSKICKKRSERHRKEFLHSTKIDCPERASVQGSHVEEFGNVSGISLNRDSEDKCQHEDCKICKKSSISKDFSQKAPFLQRQKSSFQRSKFKHGVQKNISYEIRSDFASDPKLPQAAALSPNNKSAEASLQANTEANRSVKALRHAIAEVNKNLESLQQDNSKVSINVEPLPQVNTKAKRHVEALRQAINKEGLYETPKSLRSTEHLKFKRQLWQKKTFRKKKIKRKVLLESKRENASTSSTTKDAQGKIPEIRASTTIADQSNSEIEHPIEHMHIMKSRESIAIPSLHISTANAENSLEQTEHSIGHMHIIESPESINASSHISTENTEKSLEGRVVKDTGISKKTTGSELMKQKINLQERKSKEKTLTEKSPLAVFSKSVNVPIEEEEIVETHSLRISEQNSPRGRTINDADISRKATKAKLIKQKVNLHKRKVKKKLLKSPSTISSSNSIRNFIVPTEEESVGSHSLRIPERNSPGAVDDSWNFMMVKLKKLSKNQENKKSDEETEEIISTPSSTITQDSVEYMTTSDTEESNKSGNSTENFLEEMGLYESEPSVEPESSELMKIKNLKKGKSKDSKKKKSLAERLREYKEYLTTIPIDDLSLKIRRELKH